MKQASVVVISVFLSSAVFCIAERPATAEQPIPTSKPDVKPVVTFHLLGDDKLTGPEAFKLPLKKLTLNEKPLLTGRDVLFYERKNCQLFLAPGTVKRMVKAIGPRRQPGNLFVPLIVAVRGEKRFLCALSGAEPSFLPFQDSRVRLRNREIEMKLGGAGAVTLLSPWGGLAGKDPRDDAVFLKALGEAKKLDESTLARPRINRDKVIQAARKMNINYRHGRPQPKTQVPDSWKVASVTFCREVVFAAPSVNIIGMVGPFHAHCVWVVRFDASADPASKKATWRPVACLVDDATGKAFTIYPPHFIKALTVPDTDVMASKPLGTEKDARKTAGKHLKEITEVRFCESLEMFPFTREKKFQVWRPMRRVWICDGIDLSGNRRRILLTTEHPGRRGPRMWFKGGRFRLRRIIPVIPGKSWTDEQVGVMVYVDRKTLAPGESFGIVATNRVLGSKSLRFPMRGHSPTVVRLHLRTPDGGLFVYWAYSSPPQAMPPLRAQSFGTSVRPGSGCAILKVTVPMVNPSPSWLASATGKPAQPNFRAVGRYEIWVEYRVPEVDGAPTNAWHGHARSETMRLVVREIPLADRRKEPTAEHLADIAALMAGKDSRMKSRDRLVVAIRKTENEGLASHIAGLLNTHQLRTGGKQYPRWWRSLHGMLSCRASNSRVLRIKGPYLKDLASISMAYLEHRMAKTPADVEGRGLLPPVNHHFLVLYSRTIKGDEKVAIVKRLGEVARRHAKIPPRGSGSTAHRLAHFKLAVSWYILFELGILYDGMPASKAAEILGGRITGGGVYEWYYSSPMHVNPGLVGTITRGPKGLTIRFRRIRK